jgi:hypothetical protein
VCNLPLPPAQSVLTYARLKEALCELGFVLRVFERTTIVLRHAPTGALVTFPKFPDAQPVFPHHRAAVRMTLDAFGIVPTAELAALLT